MKTNFKEYLEKKKTQQKIDALAKKYEGKTLVLYGAGLFAGDLLRNYDLSKLNIVGVADKRFQDDSEGEYYGYKKFGPFDLLELKYDLLLITTYDDTYVKKYLKNDLYQGEEFKPEIKTLVRLNIIEYIADLFKGEL